VEKCDSKPEMARTSAFFGSVTPKAFCQKRLKLSFPAPFFFVSFAFGELAGTNLSEITCHFSARFFLDEQKEMKIKKEGVFLRHPLL
jgi:hypothetical protein